MRSVPGLCLLLLGPFACGLKGSSTTACNPPGTSDGGGECISVSGIYMETAANGRSACGGDAGGQWPAFSDDVTVTQTSVGGVPGPDVTVTLPGGMEPTTGTLHTDLSITFDAVNYETVPPHDLMGVVTLAGEFSTEKDGGVIFDGTYTFDKGATTTQTTSLVNACAVEGTTFWLPTSQ